MAVPLPLTGASCLHSRIGASSPKASQNCATKVFTGWKSQSTSLFSSGTPNLGVEFNQKMNKSLQIKYDNKRRGGPISLMPIGTPMVPIKSPDGKSHQWVDLWNYFYTERVVFLGRVIDENFSNQMLATLLYLDTLGSEEPILLYINSPGGDITPCLALYDTIQSLETPVGTYCLNKAGDMVAFILAAGEKDKRIAMPNSQIILQSPVLSTRGRADDVQVEARELIRIHNYLVNELAIHTGQPVEKVHKDLNRTKYFNTEEAIAYGVIDRCAKPIQDDQRDEQGELISSTKI